MDDEHAHKFKIIADPLNIPKEWLAPSSVVKALNRSVLVTDPLEPKKRELYCQDGRDLGLIMQWLGDFDPKIILPPDITDHLILLGRINQVRSLNSDQEFTPHIAMPRAANDHTTVRQAYERVVSSINTTLMRASSPREADTVLFGATLPATLPGGMALADFLIKNGMNTHNCATSSKELLPDDAMKERIAQLKSSATAITLSP